MNAGSLLKEALLVFRKHGLEMWVAIIPFLLIRMALDAFVIFTDSESAITSLASMLLQTVVVLAAYRILFIREQLSFELNGGRLIVYMLCGIFISVATALGLMLFVVPGVLVLLLSSLAPFFILLRSEGPMEAIASSVSLVKGYLLPSALLLVPVFVGIEIVRVLVLAAFWAVDLKGPMIADIVYFICESLGVFVYVVLYVLYRNLMKQKYPQQDDGQETLSL